MSIARILIVDDERSTRAALQEAAVQLGYQAAVAASAEEALLALAADAYDVVILDMKMPGADGQTVLLAAPQIAPQTAFIVLTAYASAETAITALRSRAFDYLTKPSSLETIFNTVAAALTRQQEQERQLRAVELLEQALDGLRPRAPRPSLTANHLLQVGHLVLNQTRQSAIYQQQPLELTPVEYKLLLQFARRPNTVLTYHELAHHSHELALDEEEARQLLRTHLFRLSRKLGNGDGTPLQSVRGRGYILVEAPSRK
jgi:two-component system alkaline phosphatase synthesis response regulator PhoP